MVRLAVAVVAVLTTASASGPAEIARSSALGLWSHRLLPDHAGRVVAVALSREPAGVAVVRYLPSGTVDRTFRRVLLPLGAGGLDSFAATLDGRTRSLYVVGCSPPECHGTLVVRRVSRDGAPDVEFAARVEPTAPDVFVQPRAVAVQGDGKVIVVADAQRGSFRYLFVARLRRNGSLDRSFGVGGIQTNTRVASAGAAAIDAGGRIVIAGAGFVARYGTNGRLDETFGIRGIVALPKLLAARDVLVTRTGALVVAGSGGNRRSPSLAVARIASDGTLATRFGLRGVVLDKRRGDHWGRLDDITALADGRLMATGWATRGGAVPSRRYRIVVLALGPRGLDRAFAARGRRTVESVEGRGYVLLRRGRSVIAVGPDDDLRPRSLVFARVPLGGG